MEAGTPVESPRGAVYNRSPMLALVLSAALAVQQDPTGALVGQLRNGTDAERAAAATSLGYLNELSTLPHLVKALSDPAPAVVAAAADALKRISTKDFGSDPAAWTTWWETEGMHLPTRGGSAESVLRTVSPRIKDLETEVEDAKRQVQIVLLIVGLLWLVFLIAIIYFAGHLASKLKEWKEVMKQADHYIRQSEEITKRTDRILEELESKRTEIMEFFGKLKDENQGELERFADMLEQNTEHKIRLEVMALRQKAEKEMTQTINELQAHVDHEIRRGLNEQRDAAQKELVAHHQKFLADIEAHTLFIQGAFYASHNRKEQALKTFKDLLARRPDHHVGWTSLANVLRDLGRHEEALEAYQKALALAPTDPTIHYGMAAVYASTRKKEAMLQSLARAFQNDGEFKDEALNDPAFKPYWEDPEFKDLAVG